MPRYGAPAAPCCENPSPFSGSRAPHSPRAEAVRLLPSDSVNRSFLNPLTEGLMARVVGRHLLAAAAALLVAGACNDSQGPKPDALLLPLPGLGAIVVSTVTTGSSLDPDGYTVVVDGSQSKAIGINNSVTFSGLSPGNHSVQLNGLAQNCSVSSNPRTVSITAGNTTTTTFSVSCAPTTGSLAVTTNTTGSNLDPDGYTLTVDGGQSRAIGINNTVTISGLSPGNHSVQLNGLAQNCTVKIG